MEKRIINNDDLFEGAIRTSNVINTIGKTLNVLENSPSKSEKENAINIFYDDVKKWQIIIIKPNNDKIWMQAPMSYYEVERTFSFAERMSFLFKKGIIVNETIKERYADIRSNMKYPVELILEPVHAIAAKSSEHTRTHYTLIALLNSIKDIINDNIDNGLAIYEKPYGVIAANKSKYHLSEMERLTGVLTSNIQSSIEVVDFSSLVKDSLIFMDSNHLEKEFAHIMNKSGGKNE